MIKYLFLLLFLNNYCKKMSSRNSVLKSYLTDSNRKMRKNLINIGIETEKDKGCFNYFSSVKKGATQFPYIETLKNINDFRTKYNTNFFNSKTKNLNLNYTDKAKISFTESENDIPKITSKFNNKNDNYYYPNSVKKMGNIYKTMNNYNFSDDIENNSNFFLKSIKKPKFNFLNVNNISNINNIYNKNDFLKSFITSLNSKNNKRSIIIIKNLRNSESDVTLNENEKNSIIELLKKKTTINFSNKFRPKKIKHKDEFKEFLKEVLKDYKNKNVNKIKKKININSLLYSNKIKNKNIENNIKKNSLDFNAIPLKSLPNEISDNNKISNSIFLRNDFLDSKINKNQIRNLTEDLKPKKRTIFNMYKFKKNRIIMNQVEEELLDLETKIKKNFDKFKKNIDEEPVILA